MNASATSGDICQGSPVRLVSFENGACGRGEGRGEMSTGVLPITRWPGEVERKMSLNLATMLRESAVAHPNKPVALYDGGRLSYAELDALSDRFAAGLSASGLAPGDRVGLQLPNIPQFLIAYFGMLKAGCIAVPLNVLLKAPELAYCLTDAQARTLVTWAGIADQAIKGASEAAIPAVYVVNTPGVPESQLVAGSRSCWPPSPRRPRWRRLTRATRR